MKSSTETKVTLKLIDAELKRLLDEDLKKFRAYICKNNQGAKQAA